MNLFDQDLVQYVLEQCQLAFSGNNEKGEVRIFIQSMPPDHVLHLFQAINEYSFGTDHNLDRHFKVATGLWEYWQEREAQQPLLNQLNANDWVDHEDRLTLYRNLSCPDDRDGLLVILVGLDHATDQGGLADFHVVTDDTLWEHILNSSYRSWVSRTLDGVDANGQSKKLLLDLFNALNRYRHRDLLGLSDYIETKLLDKPIDSAQDIIDLLFETLPDWGVPPLLQVPSNPKQALGLFNLAHNFISHQLMDTPVKRKKVLNLLDKLIDEELLDIPETLGNATAYPQLEEYIETVQSFIHNNDLDSRDRLLKTDMTQLLKLLLRPNKRISKSTEKVKKLYGPSLQVFYEAVWLSFVDFKKGCGAMWAPELLSEDEGVIITINAFKHDLNEEEIDEGETQAEAANKFLVACLGGLDVFLKNRPLSLYSSREKSGNSDIQLRLELLWGSSEKEINYKVIRTTPIVEFEIYIPSSYENHSVRRKFAWVIDGTVGERVRVQTARTILDSLESHLCLPAFKISRVMTELFFAADEEEANRLFKEGLTDLEVIDVLDGLIPENVDDHLWSLGNDVQKLYRTFLKQYLQEGYYVARDNTLHKLIIAYEKIAKALLKKDIPGRNQYLNRFYKAFLALPTDIGLEESFLPHAVALGVTPAVAELTQAREAFLGDGFSEVVTLLMEGDSKSARAAFDRLIGLVELRRPLICLAKNQDHSLTTRIRSFDLIHCIGDAPSNELSLASQSIMREESFDGIESISGLIRVNEESRVVCRLLEDYCKLHPYAHDQLQVLVVNVADLHVTLAGVQQFLVTFLEDKDFLGTAPFHLNLKVITTSSSPTVSANQLVAWRDYWLELEAKETTRKLHLSIGHSYATEPVRIESLLNDEKNTYDIAILMRFLDSREGGDEVEPTNAFVYDVSSSNNIRKFPISEYPQPVRTDDKLYRRSLLSNRRLRIPTLHAELSAHLKHPNDQFTDHIVLGLVDYSPWRKVVNKLHGLAQWVACLDPYVDKSLLETGLNSENKDLNIIGFSSGLGLYGELNLTVSTQADTISSLVELTAKKLSDLYPNWIQSICEQSAKTVIYEAQEITGLSLVKSTGDSQYIRDVVAYSATRKLLGVAKKGNITELVPIDSFRHWFNDCQSLERPDLLYLDATLNGEQLSISATVIECKLAKYNERHLTKAVKQVDAGLSQLCRVFMPNRDSATGQLDFDRRYWWAQLQRTLASRAMVNMSDENFRTLSIALEKMAEGYFQIEWKALIITFWNDKVGLDHTIDNLGKPPNFDMKGVILPSEFSIFHRAYGSNEMADILTSDVVERLVVPGKPLSFVQDTYNIIIQNSEPVQENDFIKDKESEQEDSQDKESEQKQEASQNKESDQEQEYLQDKKPLATFPERILLGTTRNEKKYFWEFGHSQLNNRHLLIFGTSGSGKTYAIQSLLTELAKQDQNSLIIDYTDGFLPDHLESELIKKTNPKNHYVFDEPLPINPFHRQEKKIIKDKLLQESFFDVASRVATIFNAVYSTMGEQQNPLLIKVLEDGLNNDPSYTFNSLIQDLEANGDRGESIAAKLTPFIRSNPFAGDNPDSWGEMLNNPKERVQIIQLTAISRDIQRIITEFVLWDIYNYAQTHGSKDNPIPIILDEIQNLDHRADSPLDKLLREGRKFGISLILATQTINMFDKEQQSRLFLAGHKLFFAPAGKEVREFASLLRDSVPGSNLDEWIEKLNSLGKGECLSLGPVRQDGGDLKNRVIKLKITSLEERS